MITHHHRYLSTVPRWSVVPTSRFQNVAEHSYFVSLYVSELLKLPCFDHWTQDRKFCALRYALVHDVAEARMSDIPGPVKRLIKDPAKFEEVETSVVRDMGFVDKYGQDYYTDADIRALVKVADLVDEFLFLTMEETGGNGHVAALLPKVRERLLSAIEGCDALNGYREWVRDWVDTMLGGIAHGVMTLQNNADVDKTVAECSDRRRCGLEQCPVCEGIPF